MAQAPDMQDAIIQRLTDLNKRFKQPLDSKHDVLKVLKQASTILSEITQGPGERVLAAMRPCMSGLIHPNLLKHEDKDIQLFVAVCLSEIIRIVAPDALYSDDLLREIFALIVSTFKRLNETSSPYFGKVLSILETVAKVRSCVMMLDLNCEELILEMFQTFFSTVRDDPPNLLLSMKTIMCLVLEENDESDENEDNLLPLLDVLLSNLLGEKEGVPEAANNLAGVVCEQCATKLGPWVTQFITNMREGTSLKSWWKEGSDDLIWAIYKCSPNLFLEIYKSASNLLSPVLPKIVDELLADGLDTRLTAVKALGRVFEISIADEFKPLVKEFIKRFTDKAIEVRLAVIACAKSFLLAHPDEDEAAEVISALSDRLQDYDVGVRVQGVVAICDFAKANPKLVSQDVLRRVGDRLLDTERSVRQETLRQLTDVYRTFCTEWSRTSIIDLESFSWIPSKIIRYCFDKGCKEFRAQALELVFSEELFPFSLPVRKRVECWIAFFTAFEKTDIKGLEGVLIQKQRLQTEMKNYLSARQKLKEEKSAENQRKVEASCKIMATSFMDADNAEKKFQKFNHLKETTILTKLAALLDPGATFDASIALRDGLLKKLEKKHHLFEFVKVLATKCSHILFGKDHMEALLSQIEEIRGKGVGKSLEASVDLLAVFASRFPSLLDGKEGEILPLLKEENEHVKEGVVQILAKLGGTLRGQLTEESNSVDMLEKLCIEGSRKQAKYAVQALVGISSDSGITILSALYRKLLDLLETGAHLPTVLQSLGCIAQNAISVFETRQEELVNFLVRDLFRRESAQLEDGKNTSNHDLSDTARLKVFGLKTLVKSFLPNKDGQQRQRVKGLFGILAKFLECGDISDEIRSTDVDKAYLRLAAAKGVLRLSKRWDSQISPQLFELTVLLARDAVAEVRSEFLAKVHQFLKERALPHKYACAFVFSISDDSINLREEATQHLGDFIESSYREARRGDYDVHLATHVPEYVLVYLVHVLAQEAAFPNLSEGGPSLDEIRPYFKQLSFFIWMLVSKDTEETDAVALTSGIFRAIKHAEDVVDPSKTENAYILCDIGIAIIESLPGVDPSSAYDASHITLPTSLYKALESVSEGSQKEDGSHLPACFKEGEVLEEMKSSLPFKMDEIVVKGKRKADDGPSGDNILQPSKRTRPSEPVEVDTQDDARVTPKPPTASESNDKIRKADSEPTLLDANTQDIVTPTSPRRKRSRLSKENGDVSSSDAKRARPEEALSSMLSDKRKRGRPKASDSLKDDTLKNTSKDETPLDSPPGKSHDNLGASEPVKSGNTANDIATKKPVRLSIKQLKPPEEPEEVSPQAGEEDVGLSESVEGKKKRGPRRVSKPTVRLEVETEAHELKSPRGTPRRATKSMSILGLKSPDSKSEKKGEALDKELLGCRIKVWWPMDKQYYNGTVESYDASTKKYTVVYDDGDVEFLKLEKQRWERLLDDDNKAEGVAGDPEIQSPSAKARANKRPRKSETSTSKTDVKTSGGSKRKRSLSSPKARKERKTSKSKASDEDEDEDEGEPEAEAEPEAEPEPEPEPSDASEEREIDDTSVQKSGNDAASEDNMKSPRRPGKKTSTVVAKGSSKKSKQDDNLEGSANVTPSADDTKDSDDDIPLDVWKMSRRKGH